MWLYDAMKDVAKLAQKADNIELYQRLIDLSAQALDLQAENTKLKEENAELRKKRDLASEIVRHKEPYITLRNDEEVLRYCSHCWDTDEKLVQLACDERIGTFECPHCKVDGVFDKVKNDAIYRNASAAYDNDFL
jgi:regulator of replication initiation timing